MRRAVVVLIAMLGVLGLLLGGLRAAALLRETEGATDSAPANGMLVATHDATIHVSTWGPGEGRTLLFTHGMAAWGGLWRDTAERLAMEGYRVVAVDLPPFGFSERPADLSRTAQAARLADVIEALELDRPLVVGHSYGGGVAAELMLRRPDLLGGAVLVCPVLGLDGNAAAKSVPAPLRSDLLAEVLVAATVTNPLATPMLVKRFMHRTDALTADHVTILQRPGRRRGSTEAMVAWLRAFLHGDPAALSRSPEAHRASDVPYALIWGTHDTVVLLAEGERLARLREPVAFTTLGEVGHMPQIEAPALFDQALLDALVRLDEMPPPLSALLRPTF